MVNSLNSKANILKKIQKLLFFITVFIFSLSIFTACVNGRDDEKALTLSQIFEKNISSVCIIKSDYSQGSGFVIKVSAASAYIATNKHTFLDEWDNCPDGQNVRAIFNNAKEYSGALLGYNSYHDIAVVKIELAQNETIEALGFSEKMLTEGESVSSIANSFSMGLAQFNGIISKREQVLDYENSRGKKRIPVVQTTLAINAGASGCPVFDEKGLVVGVGTYQIPTIEGGRNSQDMNFYVPSKIVEKITQQIIRENPDAQKSPSETLDLDIRYSGAGSGYKFEIDFYSLMFRAVKENDYLLVTYDYDESSPTITKRIKKGDKIYFLGGLEIKSASNTEIFSYCMNFASDVSVAVTQKRLSVKLVQNNSLEEILFSNIYEKSI